METAIIISAVIIGCCLPSGNSSAIRELASAVREVADAMKEANRINERNRTAK